MIPGSPDVDMRRRYRGIQETMKDRRRDSTDNVEWSENDACLVSGTQRCIGELIQLLFVAALVHQRIQQSLFVLQQLTWLIEFDLNMSRQSKIA